MRYYLEVMDGSGESPVSMTIEFESEEEALREAHVALAEMARDGLPKEPVNMMSVELFDDRRCPIAELRLTFEVIPKSSTGTPEEHLIS